MEGGIGEFVFYGFDLYVFFDDVVGYVGVG